MRIALKCVQCFQEQEKPDEVIYPAELQDNGLYELACHNGHRTVVAVREFKFELLYDLAANAMIDGYYRGAVATFTSSLERFYEFYVKTITEKYKVPEDKIVEVWKKVSSQSERQLGAYVFLYLIEKRTPPPLLSQKKASFRNDVIHKGKIPSRDETLSYGQAVLDVIIPVLEDLKTNEKEAVDTIVQRHVRDLWEKMGEDKTSIMSTATTLSLSRPLSEKQPDLKLTIAHYIASREKSDW